MLSQERLKSLVSYDKRTGIFINLRFNRPTGTVKERTGKKTQHLVIRIDGKLYYAHQLAWLYVTGEWPDHLVDHKDQDGTNNRWKNLRKSNPQKNQYNREARGYQPKRGGYEARIVVNGKFRSLGWFDTTWKASRAYNKAKKELSTE